MLDEYPDGAWFVDLAPIVDPALVAQAAASAMGVAEQPGRTLAATLAEHLRGKRALVVLDNCEHVIEAAAALAAELVRSTADVRVLATSREALGVAAETTYAVPTLGMPDEGIAIHTAADVQALTQYEAVRLFIDRAVAVKSDFAVTNANAPAVAGICQRLDGIPLAIELAAARVKHMPPEQILARLDQRFRLLTGGGRDRLPRQQTLAAAIEWSHGLLDEAEQAVFRRLAVFRGGWTLEAAEAVCGGEPVEDWEVVDVLLRLVDKSLVVAGEQSGAARYRFLETVREYARERLIAAGERERYRERHVAYVVSLAMELGEVDDPVAARKEADPEVAMARVRAENDNLRAAVEWVCDTANSAAAGRLGTGLWRYWSYTGQISEGCRYLARLAELATAEALGFAGFTRYGFGALLRLRGDLDRAEAVLMDALAMFRSGGERLGESWCLQDIGAIALSWGMHDRALELFESSLAIKREVAGISDQLGSAASIATVAEAMGDWSRALDDYSGIIARLEAVPLPANAQQALQLWGLQIVIVGNRGDVYLELDRIEEARAAYEQSLAICESHGLRHLAPENIARFGWLSAAEANWPRAARLIGAADHLQDDIDVSFDTVVCQRRHARATAAARAALGDAAFDAAYAEGWAMDLDAAVAYALEDGEDGKSAQGCDASMDSPGRPGAGDG